MSGATRVSMPKCNEIVPKYDKHQNIKGEKPCGKPAVATWYYREISDDPHYMCAVHEKAATKDELFDEYERDEEAAHEENKGRRLE